MAAFKFGWKKKIPSNIQSGSVLQEAEKIDDSRDETFPENVDWRTLVSKNKQLHSESSDKKFQRLYDEGVSLAEEERFWEAINRWNAALEINPMSEKLCEMKSQVLMQLEEIFPAVEAAKQAIHLKPDWAEAHQTLGRALLNIGQLKLALKSFLTAEFIKPDSPELWAEDVKWTISLIEQEKEMMKMDTT